MKSNTCHFDDTNASMESIFAEIDKIAKYNNLDNKQTIRLRLIAEESVGAIKGILGFADCDLYIENEDNTYKVCLKTDVKTDLLMQDKFIELSTNKTNSAYKGFTGFLRKIADTFMFNPGSYVIADENAYGMGAVVDFAAYDNVWSLDMYKSGLDENGEDWDELEKSILASVADDIIIGATSQKIDMVIVKKF